MPIQPNVSREKGSGTLTRTVLEAVLDQLNMTPAQYFEQLSKALEDWHSNKTSTPLVSSREVEAIVQEELMPQGPFSFPGSSPTSDFLPEEPLEEEETLPRPRSKRQSRPRTPRFIEEDESDIDDIITPYEDLDDSYAPPRGSRRSLRTNRRSFRER